MATTTESELNHVDPRDSLGPSAPAAMKTHDARHTPASITVITPPNGRTVVDVAELWRFRDLLYFLAWRDVKVRYKQTALGAAWAVLQPAMMMAVFTLFFRRMAGVSSGEVPYPLFAYAGLLPWTFFSTAVAAAGNSVIGSERIITKVYFPRLSVPFAAVAASVVDFVIACGLLGVLMAYYGVTPSRNLWLAPFVYALIVLAAAGVGTLLSALNVAYRDFRYVMPFLLQVWMFATPTVYMRVAGPSAAVDDGGVAGREFLRAALALNPMTGLIGGFRATVLGGPIPWGPLAGSALVSAIFFVAGCLYFRKVEDQFADII